MGYGVVVGGRRGASFPKLVIALFKLEGESLNAHKILIRMFLSSFSFFTAGTAARHVTGLVYFFLFFPFFCTRYIYMYVTRFSTILTE